MKTEAADSEAFNPYAAPAARVDEVAPAGPDPVFFAVSMLKLTVMSVFTVGFYNVYWFYKNWKCVQQLGDDVNAPVRAVFYPIVSYGLFRRVREHAARVGVEAGFPAGILALGLFLVYVVGQYVDASGLSALSGVLFLLPVQRTVNAINRKLAPNADPNARFSGVNIFWVVVGGLILVLALIGNLVDE
jgi:hypothetical protein